MNWLLLLALPFALCCCVEPQEARQGKDRVKPLAGWPGAFPDLRVGWMRTFQQPVVGKDDKVYSQTVQYEWSGGASKRLLVTLARDPGFKTQYDAQALRRQANPPKQLNLKPYTAWVWDFRGDKDKEVMPLQKRLVVILAEDRILTLDARGVGPWEPLEKLVERFDRDKLLKALDAPPRSDFRRKLDTFRGLKLGMSYDAVREWVGDADRDIGSGIHIMVYDLDDGTSVRIGFPGFAKLIYVKHVLKGEVVDLAK
jgi:hypothetical protein